MTADARRSVGILLAVVCVIGGGILAQRSDLVDRLATADARVATLESRIADAVDGDADLGADIAQAREQSTLYSVLMGGRADFVAAVAEFSTAFTAANGKVDASAERERVLAAQEVVLAEREDAAAVAAAVAEVDEITASVVKAVADHDAEQARLAALASARVSGGSFAGGGAPVAAGGGYDRVRAALNRVGGGGVPLQEYGGACGGGSAAACASSAGVIYFTAGLAGWSDGRLHWAMAHELAHIHQFRVWGSLQASGAYAALYGGNIELLANCMAAVRGYPSGAVSCSGAQLDFGAAIWSGYVPG